MAVKTQLQIGKLVFDVKAHQMMLGDTKLQVEPKVMEVIQYFHEKQNQVVTREDLLKVVWDHQVVSDNAVTRCVSQVRKLIEQEPDNIANIETIPRVGYRLNLKGSVGDRVKSFTFRDIPFDTTIFKVATFVFFSLALFANYFYDLLNRPIDIDAVVVETLTELPGVERNPRLSPDGERLAFKYRHRDSESYHLYLMNLENREFYPVVEGEQVILNFAWSPDSRTLLLSRWNNQHERQCEIHLLSLSSSYQVASQEKIVDCGDRAFPYLVWHPASDKFYFNDRKSLDRPYAVFSYSLTSKRISQVTLPPQNGNSRGDFSVFGGANNHRLAVLRYRPTHDHQLNIYDMDNDSLLSQQFLAAEFDEVSWFGGSDDLLIKQADKLYRYDLESQEKTLVYPVGQATGDFSVSANDEQVFFVTGQADRNLVKYQLDHPQKPELLSSSTAFEQRPSFANRSLKIAYFSNQTGSNQIWIRESNGDHRQLSQSPVSLANTRLSWAPDDQSILFEFNDEIFAIDTENGKIERLIERFHRPYVSQWSNKGDAILYSSEKTGEWQIWQLDLATGEHSPITTKGGYSAAQSTDGFVYFSRLHEPGMWRLKPENKDVQPELVIEDFEVINWMSWQMSADGIYYVRNRANEKGVFFFDFAAQESTQIFPILANHSATFSIKDNEILLTIQSNAESKIQMIRLK
ncbi:hypothetical protein FLL45_17730 [Aliikangiella marina]|uniref:OmpR/PhoB-type domain-containing protein n=1 Tax=Aliikangiella marina TaxID=1712262 RepID=A0A545T462_9GAMM|nr:winged helix-turn-helix domain-containing protein [Aliikangiella marina]TQV72009.1 hypothetical protein FLL45_17450 [Aliikangiella marina]TQV72062.1 hypothetical protein FLL45_17730 [Aliikangiella marina]